MLLIQPKLFNPFQSRGEENAGTRGKSDRLLLVLAVNLCRFEGTRSMKKTEKTNSTPEAKISIPKAFTYKL